MTLCIYRLYCDIYFYLFSGIFCEIFLSSGCERMHPEDGGSKLFRNGVYSLPNYATSCKRKIYSFTNTVLRTLNLVELVRNLVAHGDAREGKWRGNWRMEWVASTLTPPPNVVYQALLKLMRTPRLPAVEWTDTPTDLNGLVRFGERRNLVSARVPSRSARAIRHATFPLNSQLPNITT